ncbi:MAG: 50S ribosomal protein L14 [Deltaproteobacteria bacterium]|nr:50S ribosomal protein L14 [Deltaproteobacteria bacterium]MCX7953403.1 50S ribosomal protein L14 [Deltaproteobacteria bacterium]
MIGLKSRLKVCDNSGVTRVVCFHVFGGSKKRYATVGDIIKVSVRSAHPTSKIPKGAVVDAVVVRVKRKFTRPDGSALSFSENACVLINKQRDPVGTRIFGPVARELREKNFMKIISLAPEVV